MWKIIPISLMIASCSYFRPYSSFDMALAPDEFCELSECLPMPDEAKQCAPEAWKQAIKQHNATIFCLCTPGVVCSKGIPDVPGRCRKGKV